jgi:hypothetical protein
MRRISPAKAGAAVGSVIGFWHLLWVTLVAVGWAKPVLDFILRLHFLQIDYALQPFAATVAAELVLVTFTAGALFGALFALVWNWLTLETAPTWATDTPAIRVGR